MKKRIAIITNDGEHSYGKPYERQSESLEMEKKDAEERIKLMEANNINREDILHSYLEDVSE